MDTFSDNSRCSSFEALNAHDPNLSKLAKAMFQKTNEYLKFEVNRHLFIYYYNLKADFNIFLSSSLQIAKIINYWTR